MVVKENPDRKIIKSTKHIVHICKEEPQSFEISRLKHLLQVTGICDPPKLHLPQSQVSAREGKSFCYKIFSKLYRNIKLNFLINFNLISSALKRILGLLLSRKIPPSSPKLTLTQTLIVGSEGQFSSGAIVRIPL